MNAPLSAAVTAHGGAPGRARPAGLELVGLSKSFGLFEAVRGIDLAVDAGHMVSLIGPSGCGKTTTLRMIAGLERPTAGRILAGGALLSDGERVVPPERRGMGMVFQTYALWPHMTVASNVGYGLKERGLRRDEIAARVDEVLGVVNMPGFGGRHPHQLSGGQQQRVALARAIAARPDVLLFDEPLSNLDAVLREQMRFEIRALQQRLGITSLYVTHSQEEALAVSDAIVVMKDGDIVQAGPPQEVYDRPRTAFVASFIGLANILAVDGVTRAGTAVRGRLPSGEEIVIGAGAIREPTDGRLAVSIRPAEIALSEEGRTGWNRVAATVRATVFTGSVVDYFVTLDAAPDVELRVQSVPPRRAGPGERVVLAFDPTRTVALEDRPGAPPS